MVGLADKHGDRGCGATWYYSPGAAEAAFGFDATRTANLWPAGRGPDQFDGGAIAGCSSPEKL
jgi:hypothetical protein